LNVSGATSPGLSVDKAALTAANTGAGSVSERVDTAHWDENEITRLLRNGHRSYFAGQDR
jgi:hypothetical protein